MHFSNRSTSGNTNSYKQQMQWADNMSISHDNTSKMHITPNYCHFEHELPVITLKSLIMCTDTKPEVICSVQYL